MHGRVDNEKYGSSLRSSSNTVPCAQGPSMRRPGLKYVAPVRDHATKTRLVPFEYSALDTYMLAFSDTRMRVLNEDGPLLRASTAISAVVSASGFAKLTSAGHGASVNEYVYLTGFATSSALNFAIAKITAVSGNDITLEAITGFAVPTLTGSERVARVFTMTSTWTEAELQSLRYLQSADTLFGFVGTKRPYSIGRYSAYDWRQAAPELRDGPYMSVNATSTRLTPSSTGNEIPDPPVTAKCTASSIISATYSADKGFTPSQEDYWYSNVDQQGWLAYEFPSAVVIDGYTVYLATDNNDARQYLDYAPFNWTFEGYTGSAWVVLDTQRSYAVWDGTRSQFFKIENNVAYIAYRINVKMVNSFGGANPKIGYLTMKRERATAANITFTASSVVGINNDTGFQSTDVGRVLRFKGSDSQWRWYIIQSVVSTTVITCQPQGDPLPDLRLTTEWRLGLWSDTTGWPTCAHFYGDRMYLGGAGGAPDKLAFTKPGGYAPGFLDFSPTLPDGTVTPDCGGVLALTGRKVGSIRWINSDDRGVTAGTVNGASIVRAADKNLALSASNAEARPATARGSADIEPVSVDQQILFVQQAGRTLRELAADENRSDGYRCPSMSLYTTHLGASPFVRLAYTDEPHSIVWVLREDGTLVGFTYNRDEGVLGWHEHTIGGTDVVIEDIASLTAIDGTSDALWCVIKRTINGATKRYIEVMQPFWREGFTFTSDANFFDSGIRYLGAPATVIRGLWHLEGQTVGILADGAPELPQVVTSGAITLASAASEVAIGLMYDSPCETMRPNAGASDGTAQGKTKRTTYVTFRLWQSQGGQYRRPGETEWTDFVHALPDDYTDSALPQITGDYGPVEWPSGYDTDGTMQIRQPGNIGLPFNLVAIAPQTVVQDRG